MEVDSLSDQDLRRLLREHGVNSPVTDSTRNVLRKKLSKVMTQTTYAEPTNYTVEEIETSKLRSDSPGLEEDLNKSYIFEAVHNTSCLVTDGDCNTSQDYTRQTLTSTEVHTPARTEPRYEEDLTNYEYTPTTMRYARHHYPSDDELRRRPLNTPRVGMDDSSSKTVKKTSGGVKTETEQKSSWASWLCNRFLLLLLLAVIVCGVVIYFHMDDNLLLKIKENTASAKKGAKS